MFKKRKDKPKGGQRTTSSLIDDDDNTNTTNEEKPLDLISSGKSDMSSASRPTTTTTTTTKLSFNDEGEGEEFVGRKKKKSSVDPTSASDLSLEARRKRARDKQHLRRRRANDNDDTIQNDDNDTNGTDSKATSGNSGSGSIAYAYAASSSRGEYTAEKLNALRGNAMHLAPPQMAVQDNELFDPSNEPIDDQPSLTTSTSSTTKVTVSASGKTTTTTTSSSTTTTTTTGVAFGSARRAPVTLSSLSAPTMSSELLRSDDADRVVSTTAANGMTTLRDEVPDDQLVRLAKEKRERLRSMGGGSGGSAGYISLRSSTSEDVDASGRPTLRNLLAKQYSAADEDEDTKTNGRLTREDENDDEVDYTTGEGKIHGRVTFGDGAKRLNAIELRKQRQASMRAEQKQHQFDDDDDVDGNGRRRVMPDDDEEVKRWEDDQARKGGASQLWRSVSNTRGGAAVAAAHAGVLTGHVPSSSSSALYAGVRVPSGGRFGGLPGDPQPNRAALQQSIETWGQPPGGAAAPALSMARYVCCLFSSVSLLWSHMYVQLSLSNSLRKALVASIAEQKENYAIRLKELERLKAKVLEAKEKMQTLDTNMTNVNEQVIPAHSLCIHVRVLLMTSMQWG
jgi:hypothetical protein